MDKIIDKNLCTGCTSCMNICPKGAIDMIEDNDGFKYPVIDKSKCINCGLCKRTCPVLNTTNNNSINKCYVGYAKDESIRFNSSSGGIFSVIANFILKNNGIVIGVSFDDNKLKHIAITENKDLSKLRGSKYLQSGLDNMFSYIKENIKDRKILFVGTPCQVAGLKSFMKREYDNLICIDLFCHGVPSPKLFNKYITELEKDNGKVLNYNFRDNSTGWDNYSNTWEYKDKKVSQLRIDNDYMKLFLSDIALRESCFNCNFKLGNKYSDITLGDFWGVKNYYPDMYNNSGVSAIIVNTDKGINIFNDISNNVKFKECLLEEILDGNPSLEKSGILSNKRKDFFKDMDKYSVRYLTKKYTGKSLVKKVKKKIKMIIKKIIK